MWRSRASPPAYPEAGARAEAGDAVGGVGERASVHRKAAAADARVELVAEPLERPYAFIELRTPAVGELLPLPRRNVVIAGEVGDHLSDLGERKAHALRGLDHR